ASFSCPRLGGLWPLTSFQSGLRCLRWSQRGHGVPPNPAAEEDRCMGVNNLPRLQVAVPPSPLPPLGVKVTMVTDPAQAQVLLQQIQMLLDERAIVVNMFAGLQVLPSIFSQTKEGCIPLTSTRFRGLNQYKKVHGHAGTAYCRADRLDLVPACFHLGAPPLVQLCLRLLGMLVAALALTPLGLLHRCPLQRWFNACHMGKHDILPIVVFPGRAQVPTRDGCPRQCLARRAAVCLNIITADPAQSLPGELVNSEGSASAARVAYESLVSNAPSPVKRGAVAASGEMGPDVSDGHKGVASVPVTSSADSPYWVWSPRSSRHCKKQAENAYCWRRFSARCSDRG
ncbi:hypothetical protein GOODEAATRI_021670, partial [Goodea atripinnis]